MTGHWYTSPMADDFASSKLGIPKTTKPANPDEIL